MEDSNKNEGQDKVQIYDKQDIYSSDSGDSSLIEEESNQQQYIELQLEEEAGLSDNEDDDQ